MPTPITDPYGNPVSPKELKQKQQIYTNSQNSNSQNSNTYGPSGAGGGGMNNTTPINNNNKQYSQTTPIYSSNNNNNNNSNNNYGGSPQQQRQQQQQQQQYMPRHQQRSGQITIYDFPISQQLIKKTEGWLMKKDNISKPTSGKHSSTTKKWKKRYFKINFDDTDNICIEWYIDDEEFTPNGSYSLNNGEVVDIMKQQTTTFTPQVNRNFEFHLHLDHGQIIELKSEHEEELQDWKDTLNFIISLQRKSLQVHETNLMYYLAQQYGFDPEDDDAFEKLIESEAEQTEAFGPGLFSAESGIPTSFTIQPRDEYMYNDALKEAMKLSAVIENNDLLYKIEPQLIEPKISEDDDEEQEEYDEFGQLIYKEPKPEPEPEDEKTYYQLDYTLCTPGEYTLNIYFNEEYHIFGSPFTVQVGTGKTTVKNCSVRGEGLKNVRAGEIAFFTIIANDLFGNRKTNGTDPFEVTISGPAKLKGLQDNNNGTYSCAYEVMSAADIIRYGPNLGRIVISVALNGQTLPGMPTSPQVEIPNESIPTNFGQVTNLLSSPVKKNRKQEDVDISSSISAVGNRKTTVDEEKPHRLPDALLVGKKITETRTVQEAIPVTPSSPKSSSRTEKSVDLQPNPALLQVAINEKILNSNLQSSYKKLESLHNQNKKDTEALQVKGIKKITTNGKSALESKYNRLEALRSKSNSNNKVLSEKQKYYHVIMETIQAQQAFGTIMDRFEGQLLDVFNHYSSSIAESNNGVMVVGTNREIENILAFAIDFDIAPQFLSKKEVISIYEFIKKNSSEMSFFEFKLFLSFIAIYTFSKPTFDKAYSTPEEKVLCLLENLGVADRVKFELITSRRNGGSTKRF